MNNLDKPRTVKRVTSIDVAKKAGVSQSTVSRALNPLCRISTELREKVYAAAKELNYRPNAIARGMASRNTHIIGLTISDTVSSYYYKLLKLFTAKMHEEGLQLMLFNTSGGEDVAKVLDRLIEYRVDSLIVEGVSVSKEFIDTCASHGIPVILFGRNIPGINAQTICIDEMTSGRTVARILHQGGAKQYAFITAKEDKYSSRNRKAGYVAYLEEQGIPSCQIEEAGFSYDEGYAAAIRLLTGENPPDAICCVTDIIALGVMDAARFKLGLRIPEDLSVISFDNIEEGRMDAFSLTTVSQPIEDMVDASIQLLLSWQAGASETPNQPAKTLFEGEVILRNSAKIPIR